MTDDRSELVRKLAIQFKIPRGEAERLLTRFEEAED